jgi:hypothetical protein
LGPQKLTIARIYELFGNVVLLPLLNGEKYTNDEGWQKTTFTQTKSPEYQRKLIGSPNVGMLLGEASGNVYAIDADSDQAAETFLLLNPSLTRTTRTKGNRGCHFWVRPKGNYPKKTVSLKIGENKWGEWRGDGGQSVIRGIHPGSKKPYQLLVDAPPLEIAFDQIKWPPELVVPWLQHEPETPPDDTDEFAHAEDPLDEKIKNNIFELCRYFFPKGVETGSEWRLGSVKGETGTSFCICLEGEKAGLCYEHNGGEGFFFTDALAQHFGITRTQARLKLERFFARGSLRLPPVLNPKAFYGVVGQVALKAAENSEADPVAVLIQLLIGFGNRFGRKPCFRISHSWHHCNLNAVLVGQSAKSRKGLSLDAALGFLSYLDDAYVKNNVKQGLSSGEGLIWHARDDVKAFRQPTRKEKKDGIQGPIEYVAELGVTDKRLLVTETEFGGTIVIMGRKGNILSSVVRQAWGGRERLGTLTKHAPVTATGAHISICGHITQPELADKLPEVEDFNGFSNRFLWIHTKRDRFMSNPPDLGPTLFAPELAYFKAPDSEGRTILQKIDVVRHMRRDEEAATYWDVLYNRMEKTEEETPRLDSITSRGSSITLRLSMIIALLDGSATIRKEHVEAAYALWCYGRDTARYLFGAKAFLPRS